MAQRCSLAPPFARLRRSGRLLTGFSVLDLHLRAGDQTQLSVGDDHFARFNAAFNDGAVRDRMRHNHGTHLDRLVGFYYEDELALLSGLDGLRRRDDRVRLRGERQAYVYELARPEPPLFVGENGFELNRARRVINRIVHKVHRPGLRMRFVVRRDYLRFELAIGHVAFDFRQLFFWRREGDVNRIYLVDHDQRRRVAGSDKVALVDHETAGAPVNRRAHGGETELQAGALHRGPVRFDGFLRRLHIRFVGPHGFGQGVGCGANLVVLIARDDAALKQGGVTIRLRRGVLG